MEFLFGIVFAAIVFLFPAWRIFARAGLAGPLALLVLIPAFGVVIVMLILAFARWPAAVAGPQTEGAQ